jgi:TetR/AcrR family transcriptional repressor of nem operon
MARPQKNSTQKTAKDKLLEAAFKLIRSKGYTATTVDDLCDEAKVTKGTFFYYFDTKEALAVAAATHWSSVTGEFFKAAPYHQHDDPFDRLIGYIEFRKDILQGEVQDFTCLVGTMVQEMYLSSPDIKNACHQSIFDHARQLEHDIVEAKERYAPQAPWTAESIALHTQAVIQGAFILAKANGNAAIAADSIDHLKNYINILFNKGP